MARIKNPTFSFDFETTTGKDKTRVWLWGSVNLDTEYFEYGPDFDSFVNKYSRINCTGYFHNLKFDVQFIFYWLFHHGYRHTTERYPRAGFFSTLISDMGVFYSAKIHFFEGGTMTLYDSLKLITMPVEKMPKAFGLDIQKLSIEYDEGEEQDYTLTEKNIQYVKNDCLIVARAMRAMKAAGMRKMTAASNALDQFRREFNPKEWDRMFPQISIDVDKDCRKAYKGGWTYLNPKYKDIRLGKGMVFDVNSMYPWAMRDTLLPWGEPIYYTGEPKPDENFPLFIHCFSCKFKLKPGMYPSIQIRGSFRFLETEYLTDSKDEEVILTMTNIDYQLMRDTYEIWDITHICGYKFRGIVGMFKDYVDKWYGLKAEHKVINNMAMYYIDKLMLNSLYGKFGSNPEKREKYPYLDEENDIVKYELGAPQYSKTAYVPVAAFITSYCRNKIIRTAIACGDRFVYADTDSVHILGTELPNIDIDDYRLGAFKCESIFDEAQFHRAKCYIESIDGNLEKKCAGLPKRAREMFNFDTMTVGFEFHGKLVPKNISGGVILEERVFTIK